MKHKKTLEQSRIDILIKTISNLEYMMKIDNNPQTLYDATRWCYLIGQCKDLILQYKAIDELYEKLSQQIGTELERYKEQSEII